MLQLKRRAKHLALFFQYFVRLHPLIAARTYYLVRYFSLTLKPGSKFQVSCSNRGDLITLRAHTTDIDIFEQIFITHDCAMPFKVEPKLIIDGGAHIGCSTIYFAQKFPKAKIIAVEAEQSNFELLRENTAKYRNVECIRAAIWGSNSPVQVENPHGNSWGFRVKSLNDNKDASDGSSIPAQTITDLLNISGKDCIDLLKLDIEGAEFEVFSSNFDPWLSKTNIIVIELHDRVKAGCSTVFFEALSQYRYSQEHTRHNVIVRKMS